MNLRCDCMSCKYEKQKSTEDPCRRCYNDSEYIYNGKEYNNYPQSRDKGDKVIKGLSLSTYNRREDE